jgi:hypothetical protein
MTTHEEIERLKDYFEGSKGTGVLATSGEGGEVNAAVFARPHVLDDDEVGFIMPERLTYRNLSQNPHAAYLFLENRPAGSEPRWSGVRLSLRKVGEEKDTERVRTLRRRTYADDRDGHFLVRFVIERVRPLVGDGVQRPE